MNKNLSNNQSRPRLARWASAALLPAALGTLLLVTAPAQAQPTTAAPTPPAHANVVSMYNSSGTYSDQSGIGWYAGWGSVASQGDYVIGGSSTVKSYLGLNYAGVEFYSPAINVSSDNMMHVDVWTTANQLAIKLVSTGNGAAAELIYPASSGVITSNHWVGLDIPLTAFTALAPSLDLANLTQLLWVDNGDIPGSGVKLGNFYFDNIYFYTATVPLNVAITSPSAGASVLTNFTITASSSVSPGTVTSVSFYDNGSLLGNATTAPYTYDVTGAAVGAHALTAVTHASTGASVTSSVVNVTVSVPTLVLFPDGNFENPAGDQASNYWVPSFSAPVTFDYPTTGGNPNGYAVIDDTGGGSFGVIVSGNTTPLPLSTLALLAGNTYTFVQDMIILDGSSIGGLKVESWGPNGYISDSGNMYPASGSSSWATYSFSYTINPAATGIKVVPLWGPNSSVGYDNIGVIVPATPLSVAITSPSAGATVNTNFTITATTLVNPGAVTNTYFYVDNALVGTSSAYPYTYTSGNPALSGSHALRVVAKDNTGHTATSSVVNVTIVAAAQPVPNYPITDAPTPTRAASSVMALYNSSGVYADQPVTTWATSWSSPGSGIGVNYTNTVTRKVVKYYPALQYAGVDFPALNLSGNMMMHVDVWSPNAAQFAIKYANTVVPFTAVSSATQLTNKTWVSLDFPINDFPTIADPTSVGEFLFVDNTPIAENATFYVDNIYFWTTNQVNSSIALGNQVSWTSVVGNSYQPQKSANNTTWVNLGGLVTDAAVTNVFDAAPAPYYQVLQYNPGAVDALLNSGFETDNGSGAPASWNSVGTQTPGWITTNAHTGTYSMDFNVQGDGIGSPNSVILQQGFVPVTSGATYTFSAWSQLVKTAGISFGDFCLVQWFDASSGFVSQSQITLTNSMGVWQQSAARLTVPANATQAQVQIVANIGAVANDYGEVLVDDVSLATGGSPSTNAIPAQVQPAVGISWQSGAGRTYQVQSTPALTPSVWSPLGANVTGNGGIPTVTDQPAAAQMFYRVLELY